MLFSVGQAFVGREEIRAPLKTPGWEAKEHQDWQINNGYFNSRTIKART